MGKEVLFEIGLEELPARFVNDAEKQLHDKTIDWLNEQRISYDEVASYSTPRRLAVLIKNVDELQASVEEEVKGPAVKIAKNDDGTWSKAAIGFTKGQGKSVDDIYIKEVKDVPYIYVEKHIEGKSTKELLPSFKEVIESIQFGKNMRWSTHTMRYARPIRWLVALYDKEIIPFSITNVETNNYTYGHRFLGEKIILHNPSDYVSLLNKNYVVVEASKRKQLILEGLKQLEREQNFEIPVDPALLDEVTNLVEFPTVFVGSFDEEFLKLPEEVLITSMKEHQRYFPVKDKSGELLAKFVGVRNGNDASIETVIKGNEKVLRARLSDAQFFYEEDQKHAIDYYINKLNYVVFQEKLGTYREKIDRVKTLVMKLSDALDLDGKTQEQVIRVAEIYKFDLVTNMVNEFTELQGIIGEKYARIFGEDEEVAVAIREHYMPVHANDELPKSTIGSLLSISDKIDTILGCISVGLTPTGSQDPYGLRRQATGILRILHQEKWNIPFETIVDYGVEVYNESGRNTENVEELKQQIHDFFHLRASYLLKESEVESDVIHAVIDKEIGIIDYTVAKARLLSNKRNDPSFKTQEEALVRVLNLANKGDSLEINTTYFQTDSEEALYNIYKQIKPKYFEAKENKDASLALEHLGELAAPIHVFFENNMVMDDNEDIRKNRLALLKNIANLIMDYANLSIIEWKQHN